LRLRAFRRTGEAKTRKNKDAGSGVGIWMETLPVIVPAIITELITDPESAAKNSTDELWFAVIQ
jgi:hypothetical protein